MLPLGALFDAMHWPVLNSWALAHMWPFVWPLFTLVSFGVLVGFGFAWKKPEKLANPD